MGRTVPYPQLVAGQFAEETVSLLPESRWWHWVLYPVVGVLAALLLAGAVIVVTSG